MSAEKKEKEIILACLELGDNQPMDVVATHMGVSAFSLAGHISYSGDVWTILQKYVDAYVEKNVDLDEEDTVQDCLMDLILLRLEALAPFKEQLKRVYESRSSSLPYIVQAIFSRTVTQIIDKTYKGNVSLLERPVGHFVVTGLYLATLKKWLSTEGTDLSETMHFLDLWMRRLDKLKHRDVKVTDVFNYVSSKIKVS